MRGWNERVQVRGFAWLVALGLGEKVCAVLVGAVLLGERTESEDLTARACGLRLPVETCGAIYGRYGAAVVP